MSSSKGLHKSITESKTKSKPKKAVTSKAVTKTNHLADPQFKRLARRAGIKRIGDIYDYSRKYIDTDLEEVVNKAIVVMQHSRLSTLQPNHILSVLDTNLSFAVTKSKKKTTKSYDTLNIYIYKVLKKVHPDTGISSNAMTQLDNILKIIAKSIVKKAIELATIDEKKTITSREIQSAIRIILPDKLEKHAVSEGTKTVTKYNSTLNSKYQVRETKSSRANLIFGPARIERLFLRGHGKNVGYGAPIYLSAVLEYLAGEILEYAGNVSRDYKRVRIIPRHIFVAVEADKELSKLFNNINITIADSGVIPNINGSLLKKTKSYKRKDKTDKTESSDEKRKHRFRPGTVALMEIRRYQKSTKRSFPAQTFERLVRNIISKKVSNIKLGSETCDVLQVYYEQSLVNIYKNANLIAISGGRETVMEKDVQLAMNIMNN